MDTSTPNLFCLVLFQRDILSDMFQHTRLSEIGKGLTVSPTYYTVQQFLRDSSQTSEAHFNYFIANIKNREMCIVYLSFSKFRTPFDKKRQSFLWMNLERPSSPYGAPFLPVSRASFRDGAFIFRTSIRVPLWPRGQRHRFQWSMHCSSAPLNIAHFTLRNLQRRSLAGSRSKLYLLSGT